MGEIKSTVAVANGYVSAINSANSDLVSDSVSITEDATTTLAVNSNSISLNNAIKQATNSISAQISDDCGRITSMATLFEEKDKALAGRY